MAKKKTGGWGLGIAAAAIAAGALLYLTGQKAPKPPPTVSKPIAKQPRSAEKYLLPVALGSYGSALRRNGQELALQIHPVAELQGPRDMAVPRLDSPREQEIIANLFLRFPQLDQVAENIAVQERLASQIRSQLNAQLAAQHSPWKIHSLQLHPSLGPIPNE